MAAVAVDGLIDDSSGVRVSKTAGASVSPTRGRRLVADWHVAPLRIYGIQTGHVSDSVSKATNASRRKANLVVLTPEEPAETLRPALLNG